VIRVLQKALEKNPADRHPDMRAFAAAWAEATGGLSQHTLKAKVER
jgi:hypothetical protein